MDFCQDRKIPVQISPARLDYRYFRILKVREGATQKIRVRHKIRIEVRNKFSGSQFQAFRQISRLEARTIASMEITNRQASCLPPFDVESCHLLSIISRVIEYLNVEQLARVIDPRDR